MCGAVAILKAGGAIAIFPASTCGNTQLLDLSLYGQYNSGLHKRAHKTETACSDVELYQFDRLHLMTAAFTITI